MSRGVKGLRQLVSQSRQVHVDDSSDDEQTNDGDVHCQATCALSSQIGQYSTCIFIIIK